MKSQIDDLKHHKKRKTNSSNLEKLTTLGGICRVYYYYKNRSNSNLFIKLQRDYAFPYNESMLRVLLKKDFVFVFSVEGAFNGIIK